MLSKFILLAQADDAAEAIKAAAAAQKRGPLIDTHLLVLLGAIAGLAALLFLFVYLLRRRTARAEETLYRNRGFSLGSGRQGRRRRKGSERSGRLRRNPTLAETGGLPPPRKDKPEPPASDPTPSQPQNS